MATEARSHFNSYIHKMLFAVAVKRFRNEPQEWKKWITMRTSKEAYEEAGYISGFGQLVHKPEGQNYTTDARIQGPTKKWVHSTFGLAARISEEAIEDVKHGIMKQIGAQLSMSAISTLHTQATRMLMTGSATTYHTQGDGSTALFSQSQPRLDGGTWSNLGDAAALTEASLSAAIQNFEAIADHRGLNYYSKAKTLICGRENEFTAHKLVKSAYEPGTANNAVNAVGKLRPLEITIDPEITDGRWFIMGEKDSDVGFIHFDRVKPTMSRHGDPETGDALFYIRTRFSNECNDPRSMYMVPEV